MAGKFMDKETLEAHAKRLNVDLTGLSWPQKQKAVIEAMSEEANEVAESLLPNEKHEIKEMHSSIEVKSKVKTSESKASEEILIHVPRDPMDDMRGKTLMICPEMAQTDRQLFGYEEELGEELIVEEVFFDVDSAYRAGKDTVTGNYKVLGKTGKKVVAQSALPKEGAGITFTPDRDYVPVVTFQGRKGYLWTHHSLPNIKQLLIQSGYYEEYRKRFEDEPWIWHSAGKLLTCDINLVHSIFAEIERKEQMRRLQQKQTDAFIKQQMGM